MVLERIGNYIDNSKVTHFLRRAFSSYFFPLVSAIVVAGCYFLALEIVAIWYLCICGTAILVCCKDVTPIISLFLFLNVLTSVKHCPSFLGVSSEYFVKPAILSQILVAGAIWVIAAVWRTVSGIVNGRFKITPVFWGLLALCVAFMLSGVFYTKYT
ncbi:MAG: hypothetical protein K2O67_02710, partial [Clostridia bacterium]|nr:hypothetical protein [Clostridia bacterium]